MTTGIIAGLWDVLSCSNKEKFICKQRADELVTTPAPSTHPPLTCSEDWVSVSSRDICVKVKWTLFFILFLALRNLVFRNLLFKQNCTTFHDNICFSFWQYFNVPSYLMKTWDEALDFCREIGGDLLSIHHDSDIPWKHGR